MTAGTRSTTNSARPQGQAREGRNAPRMRGRRRPARTVPSPAAGGALPDENRWQPGRGGLEAVRMGTGIILCRCIAR